MAPGPVLRDLEVTEDDQGLCAEGFIPGEFAQGLFDQWQSPSSFAFSFDPNAKHTYTPLPRRTLLRIKIAYRLRHAWSVLVHGHVAVGYSD